MSVVIDKHSRGVFSRLPSWFRQDLPVAEQMQSLKGILQSSKLHTVCKSAHCPNLGYCWSRGIATFMILGDVCTRTCRFCAVRTGQPETPDIDEPYHVAESIKKLKLKYAVITSVTRDDLSDGGAGHFAKTIYTVREENPEIKIEVLIPDFSGRKDCLEKIIRARPDVIGHNMETVVRLTEKIRSQASYTVSLELLRNIKRYGIPVIVKSGFMVGLGETQKEVISLMKDLVEADCDILTIGQYLAPSKTKRHLPVQRFFSPEEFETLKELAYQIGFRVVVSGPLVRSSYMAEESFLSCMRLHREVWPKRKRGESAE